MKRTIITVSLCLLGISWASAQKPASNGYPITQVPFTDVKVTPGTFWGQRLKAVRDVTIPLAFSKCQSEGRYENFVRAAHPSKDYDVDKFEGFPFDDTDVYKTIEGASYILQTFPDKKLEAYIDSVLDIVAKAQEPDGYLYTARTMNPWHPHSWSGDKRWVKEEVLSHELYDLGHMVDAAVAHYQATGSKKFLNIAERYADCVVREVGPRAGQTLTVPGHQIAEMALARLYLATGKREYLDEAKFFLDYRGKTGIRNLYSQSQQPVVDQREAIGHAVRAGYMYAGMADVAALTGDSAYIRAIDAIWNNIVSKKYYITGGVGARHDGEAFGTDYELPNKTAYNETCAAIAQVYLNQRMFLLHGNSKYIDCLERTLYNGVISGMSIDGGRFFYPNPLACDSKYAFNADNTITRQPWFGCACCPSNLCRFIPSLPGYIYAVKDNSLFVNLFTGNTSTIAVGGKPVTIEETTQYPWDGDIALKIAKTKTADFNLMIRIPGWVKGQPVPSDLYKYDDATATAYAISVNGKELKSELIDGYFRIARKWKAGDVVRIHFDMQPRVVEANEKVTDDRGRVAVERGPLVYCAEWADNEGIDVSHIILSNHPAFNVADAPRLLNGLKTLTTDSQVITTGTDGKVEVKDARLTLIPYYAWAHRGVGNMDVWIRRGISSLGD
jgi:DUF1680 family protein